jgi:hypothetical protein
MKDCHRQQLLPLLALLSFIVLVWMWFDLAGYSGTAHAATRLVSMNGVNAQDCIARPCKTIQFAINVASPGDTIFVSPGTYNENVLVTKPDLTLKGSGASSTIINGDRTANVVYAFRITSFTIEGFTVKNAGQTGGLPGSAAIHLDPAVGNGIGNWVVRNTILQDNGFGIALWNSFAGGNALIENNLISNNNFHRITNSGHPQVIIINNTNNTIVDNGSIGYIEYVTTAGNVIVNNIIASNGFSFGDPPNCPSGIRVYNFNLYIAFNDVFNNAHGNYGRTGSDCITFVPSPGTGEISADPKFQDSANGNYRLTAGSPAVDTGTNDDAPATDLDGKDRPIDGDADQVAVVDMGAFEFSEQILVQVGIDIQPGELPNSLNPASNTPIPVAILGTGDFMASTVDASTVRFGATGTEATPMRFSLEDVNRDGHPDLLLQFRIRDTHIACGDTSASLTGQTFGGQEIEGTDSITTVGCK